MTASWRRPDLPVTQPRRHFGGVYRTAEGEQAGEAIGGVPLQTASDAVVAAVQLGYKVADAQLARGRRLARGLGGAARRAGIESAAEPIDATEQLMKRTMLSMLEWFEDAAGDPQSALRRIARAEYRAFGSAFGLQADGTKAARARGDSQRKPDKADASPAADAPAQPFVGSGARLAVRHEPASVQRLVRVRDAAWAGTLEKSVDLRFHHASGPADPPLLGTLVPASEGDELRITTLATHAPGLWVAAICDATGLQLGHIAIEL